MLHGEKEAQYSEKTARETFSENSSGSNLPSIRIDKKTLSKKMSIIDLIVLSKFEKSKSEIRRLIKGNAVKVNNEIISNDTFQISENLFKNNFLKLSVGKKKHLKIEIK